MGLITLLYTSATLCCSPSPKTSPCLSSIRAHRNDVQMSPDTFTSLFVKLSRQTAGRKCVRKRDTIRQHSEWVAIPLCMWLCHDNSWRGSLGVTLHISTPTMQDIYTGIQQQKINPQAVWLVNRHDYPAAPLGVSEWGQTLQQTITPPPPPLHMFMTREVPAGCRHTAKWCVARRKATSRALKVYRKGVIKVSERGSRWW